MAKKKETKPVKIYTPKGLPTKQKQTALEKKNLSLIEKAQEFKITTQADFKTAVEYRDDLKEAEKKFNDLFKEALTDAKAAKQAAEKSRKSIDSTLKQFTDPITTVLNSLNGKIIAFKKKQDEKIAVAEKKAEKTGRSVRVKDVAEEVEVSFVSHWQAEVIDFKKLPDEYKLPNTTLLNKLAKEQQEKLKIAGVKAVNNEYLRG